MTDTIAIPAGVRLWLKDPNTNAAITALAGKPAAPKDLAWKDFPTFVQAQLTAATIQAEYAVFLHQVWEKTWGRALQRAKLPVPGPDWRGNWPNASAKEVWKTCLTAQVKHEERHYVLSVSGDGMSDLQCGIRLGFFAEEKKYTWSNDLPLREPWLKKPEVDERWTRDDSVCINGQTVAASLVPLVKAAREVAALIAKRC